VCTRASPCTASFEKCISDKEIAAGWRQIASMGCVVVQLGQGGNQMASAFFNALASLSHPATASQDFFRDNSTGEHIARAVLIDMEPKVWWYQLVS